MTNHIQQPAKRKTTVANMLLIAGLGILLCGESYFGYRLHTISAEQEQIKEDYSVVNSITFGIFSVDQWREKISAVVGQQVNGFSMTAKQKAALQAQVTDQLNGLINKTVAQINKPQKSLGGKLKKLAFNSFVDEDELHALVPVFSKTIITKINSPASKRRLKRIANSKMDQLEDQTYDKTEIAKNAMTRQMFAKYQVSNASAFDQSVKNKLRAINNLTYHYAYAMMACVLCALVLWFILRKKTGLQTTLFIMSLLFALVLLASGITTTIIEVDARIQTLNFKLFDENIAFTNQVLFFQSKSILGIIETLMKQPKPDSILVGALLMLFVIALPVLRLLGKGLHVWGSDRFAESKVVRYLAFESGKWDMSDVMVVGVAMTYIGLNGILKSQLSNLNMDTGPLKTVTENNSSLQPGYLIFVGYVIFAMVLSYILKRIAKPEEKKPQVLDEENVPT
ncbi:MULTISPECIES: paraquat-inducible protein A [unclassified Pedobacter]|uniref:paraquat-inducible protein A n=1 Tax=Pedobacter TaxID=84567 RepID=UPI00209C01F2|nr:MULTISPECIES: paraquat-inducible protein A [unclassified Pedobacter]MCX2429991.1 paraquat-inducible protein A [Pedobacter sp. GR22-10]